METSQGKECRPKIGENANGALKCSTLQQTGILKPACSLCLMSTAETGPDQSCMLKRAHSRTDEQVFASWPSSTLSCAKFKANSNCQWLPHFVALHISTIIRPVKIYTISPSPIPASQREVQFCALLQVPIRLYGDTTNLKISTASLHLQYTTKCSCGVTQESAKYFAGCRYTFRKHLY
jgi:hypothetical protein